MNEEWVKESMRGRHSWKKQSEQKLGSRNEHMWEPVRRQGPEGLAGNGRT